MRLPTLLMRIIDPAQVYFDQVDGGRPRSVRRLPPPAQRLSERPESPGGKMHDPYLAEITRPPDLSRNHPFIDLAAVRWRYDDKLREAARALVESGHARVEPPVAELDARLVTFWRGDGVLEVRRSSATSGGTSRSRIEHERLQDEEMFADYLAARLAQAIGFSS